MKDFVTKLKRLGRYENSLIILQSDHGTGRIDAALFFKTPPPEVRQKVQSRQKLFEPDDFFLRLHALLLIKSPDSEAAPIRFSEQVSQLADIPATVYDVLGLPPVPSDGHSVFALDEVEGREISVFAGIYDRNSAGKALTLGQHRHRATLGHLGYHPDRGWSVHADIEATHEGW